METILDLQQRIKGFFASYDLYIMPVLKFLASMAVLLTMNWHLGYRLLLMRWVLVILVCLVCALLPWNGITVVAGIYLLGHVSALSWEGAVLLGAAMLVAALLQYMFLPGAAFVMVLVPMAFYLHIPYLVPLLVGIFCGSLAFIPVGAGVLIYYVMQGLENNAYFLLDTTHTIAERFAQILQILTAPSMILAIVAFCLVTLSVYALRRMSFDYSRYIAVIAGAVLMLLIYFLGSSMASVQVMLAEVLLGCLVCGLLALAAAVWTQALNYSRTEFLEYEDDEYVYYVKAVPKVVVQRSYRKVREISSRNQKEEEEE